ncbi:hypothetical protein ACFLTQ_03010 [Chloroflexota bacterium]
MKRLVAIGLAVILMLIPIMGMSCGSDSNGNGNVDGNDNVDTTESPIPTHFTTYTDEMTLFSISYPPNFELALSQIDFIEENVKEILLSIDSGLPVEQVYLIFAAGVPAGMQYSPNVSIGCESLPGTEWTHDEVIEAEVQSIKSIIEDYHEFSRTDTTIDGRKATIINFEGTFPTLVKAHLLQMYTCVDKIVWIVTCTSDLAGFVEYEDDFYHIVRSLRILK